VRAETPEDEVHVRAVNAAAFPTDAEARLVDVLRGNAEPQISLVAEHEAGVVGHILFTPVEIRSPSGTSMALGLAPMAVLPAHQRRGIGSALVRTGLEACREAGELVVIVLGHPEFYPRFGFCPAWDSGLYFETPGPMPAFMVCELVPDALGGRTGQVRYHDAFYDL